LIVESANDAAVALARYHSGTVEAFAKVMNERAIALGALNSNFINPHGLDDPEHLSTAKDLALIAAEAMKSPDFRNLVSTQTYTINPTNKKEEARNYLRSNNYFIRDTGKTMMYDEKQIPIYDERIDGIKTGYTTSAGNCLISTISQNGSRFISVVLGAGIDNLVYVDSKHLLEYGITNFKNMRLISAGESITNIKVPHAEQTGLELVAETSISKTVPIDFSEESMIKDIQLFDLPEEPIKTGMPLGTLTLIIDGQAYASTNLLAQRDIETGDLIGSLSEKLSTRAFETPFDYIVFALKLLLALSIWRWIIVTRRRRIKAKIRQEKLREIRSHINEMESTSNNVYQLSDGRKKKQK
jgi:D-alanyl-D-alanine carboxypeptidase (penicillin-binding protein 5/6)